MSGIVGIMFCGIAMARYALPNLSENGLKVNITKNNKIIILFQIMKKLYHTLAYNFENIVFIFIGIGFFGFDLAYKFSTYIFFFIFF